MSKELGQTYDELLKLDFKFNTVELKDHPDKQWLQLDGVPDLDKYVWTYTKMEMQDDGVLEFEIEVANADTEVPEALKPYAASLIIKSLQKMVDEGK